MSGEGDLEEGFLMFVGGGGWCWRYSGLGAASLRLCTAHAQETMFRRTNRRDLFAAKARSNSEAQRATADLSMA